MMKKLYVAVLIMVLKGSSTYSQTNKQRIVFATSQPKHINTLPLFTDKQDNQKENSREVLAKKEVKPAINNNALQKASTKPDAKPVKQNVAIGTNIVAMTAGTSPNKNPVDAEGYKKLFFDKQLRRYSNQNGEAYFYRQAKFDKMGMPIGIIKDFYVNGDHPKFEGQYKTYIKDDESSNKRYDGKCTFYEEDGAYAVIVYKNGYLKNEEKFNKDNRLLAQVEYNNNYARERKKFIENDYKNGQLVSTIEGGYNGDKAYEEATQTNFYPNRKIKSEIKLVNGCPDSKEIFHKENDEKYEVYYQDFTCEPDFNKWKFTNSGHFTKTYKKDKQEFVVRLNTDEKGIGIVQLPIKYDFNHKPFEIEAVFDIDVTKPMAELGVVWEFQDANNYCYLKFNLKDNKYEINYISNGIPGKTMLGITPKKINLKSASEKQLTLIIKRISLNEMKYSINGEVLKQQIKDATIPEDFKKIPKLDKDYPEWGIGWLFNPNKGESVILKKLEVKLL